MNRQQAIAELDWYLKLTRNKLRYWGSDLPQHTVRTLVKNIEDVIECGDELTFRQDEDGYYIGQVDEELLRHGYGVYTHTTTDKDRWVMQAGYWNEERAVGLHTLYDSDCPKSRHYIAAVEFTGNRRRERGMVQYSISERGIDTRQRKYRRWEGFSLSTVLVGSAMVYLMMFAIIRNARLAIIVVGIVLFLYLIGIWRGRQ